MSSSCSHWWHAPVYIAATIALIIAAISSSSSSSSSSSHPPPPTIPSLNLTAGDPIPPDLILSLHRSGFHLTALILQISAVRVFPASLPATLFAVPDSALSNLSFPAAERLFRYHTVPLSLSLSDLIKIPRGTCLPTLLNKDLIVTSSNGRDQSISINGVPVSHPDLFTRGLHMVHGVDAPLLPFDGGDFPICESKKVTVVPWDRVVRALGARGYVSFSVGLSAVLDAVVKDSLAVDHVTVFAPRDSGFDYVASPAPMLEKAVRRHVAVGRFGSDELAAMHVGEEMRTLAKAGGLRITAGGRTGMVEIDGVEVTEPEVYADEGVVVHGIAQAFGVAPPVT